MRARVVGMIVVSGLLCESGALAQQQGFALNRYEPAERGSEWFAQDTLDLRGHLRPAIGVTGDWGYKPLVVYNRDDSEREVVVRHQVYAHVGASVVLIDRIRFGLNIPIAAYQAGTDATLLGVRYGAPDKTTIGDIRLGGDVRLAGQYGDAFTVAIGLQAFIPSGSREQYTGDGKVRLTPRAQVAGDLGPFAYALRLGLAYRGLRESFGDSTTGTELTFGASAGARLLDRKLLLGPELYGTTVLADGRAFETAATPVEVLFGGHYTAGDFRFGLGAGPGLSRGFGAPRARVLLSFEWAPQLAEPAKPVEKVDEPEKVATPEDDDGDGILNPVDACPKVAGKKSDDPKKHGCPDKDGDGIVDGEDACVDVPGVSDPDPKKNGCPPDKDGDGIYDADDACVDVPGVKSTDPKKNGCPPDSDGDGVLDAEDACPDTPGPKNADPKKNGCPAVAIVAGQIKILQQVKFKTNSAEILKESDEILSLVAKILTDHPELTSVRVEGHTDNKGGKAHNKDLSKRRAASVVQWLVTKGKIDKKRLKSEGFGDERPIDSNDNDEGRQNNRRVEFHIEGNASGKIEEKK